MKILKHILVVILILLGSGLISYYSNLTSPFYVAMSILFISFLVFNIRVRKKLSHKNYFTNKFNLFTTKVYFQKSFDIPKELMFDKIIEVINNSNLQFVESNKETFEVLAISKMTIKSWGENLYISFDSKGNETIMMFCSTTLFQMYSWGKNEENYEYLSNEIENSLII